MSVGYVGENLRSLHLASNEMAAHAVDATQGFIRRGWARLSRKKQRATTAITTASGSIDESHEAIEPLPTSNFQRPQHSHNNYQIDNQIDPTSLPNRKNIVNRSMDRLRRSFRKSFSRGGKSSRLTSNQQNSMEAPISASGSSTTASSSKNNFQQDENSVRNGTCQFQVKYLGSCEVFESRGMHVCENALRHLRERKRSTKAILYVSGDSLRVVDQEHSRGLILDQTVEKVSFCAPDRRNDKGFAYICRDGATRRWMCHGFQAVKDSSERLSHAVGCSFAICLEKKRKREAEIEVLTTAKNLADEVNADRNGLSKSNQAYNSFRRQLSLSERREDPQRAIMVNIPSQRHTAEGNLVNFDDMSTSFDRQQSSFHVPNNDQPSALRRFHSLRNDIQNKIARGNLHTLYNEPIYEGDDEAWPGCENQFDNGSFSVRTPRDQNDQNKENGHLLNGMSASGSGFTLKPLPSNGPKSSSFQPITSTTTAEDWLEKALQSTLTVSSSKIQSTPMVNGSNGHLVGMEAPSQPSPPLPPASILASPDKSIPQQQSQELDVPEQPARQSIKYHILEETDAPPHSPPRLASPLTRAEVDIFGQPIFNPLQPKSQQKQEVVEAPSAFVQLCSQKSPRQNGLQYSYLPPPIKTQISPTEPNSNTKSNDLNVEKKKEEIDPFDVGWSSQILESARSTTNPNSTPRNDYSGEQATVNV